jgi:aspartyl protease family protein
MARTYLFFLLVAGVFAALMPSGKSSTHSLRGDGSQTFERSSHLKRGDTRADPSPDTVQLERESNGHFYADVQINGSPIRVLVDTGASGIALSRDDAQRAGLAVSAGMFNVVGEGADGDVHGEYVTLDRVSLGSKSAEKVPAVVLDAGGQSLLGQSFLSQFETVEIRGDTMVLR